MALNVDPSQPEHPDTAEIEMPPMAVSEPAEIEMPPMQMGPDPHTGHGGRGGHGRGGHGDHGPRGVLDKETDARFWASTGYRPGQKLNPADPQDAKMALVWLNIFQKVKAEQDAGKLVLTYNHPVVAQNLADAHVADQAAIAHLDAAATAPDPAASQQNVAAAATAVQISTQKTREAAQLQPPTVSRQLAHQAGHQARREPPPHAMATGREHLAHQQVQGAGHKAEGVHRHHGKRHRVKSTMHPGKMKDWRRGAAKAARGAGSPYVLVLIRPDGSPARQAFRSRAELEAAYTKISEQHDQYKHVAAFDLATSPQAPVHDSFGVPAAEHAEVPPAAEAAATPASGSPREAATAAPAETAPAPAKSKWSTGTIIAIAAGVAAVGGLVYMSTRKPTPPRRSPREAEPTSMPSTRLVPSRP